MEPLKRGKSNASIVRVSIDYNTASDIGSFKKVFGSILDKLGCQACCSGFDIHFDIEKDYFIDSKINIRPLRAQSAGASARTNPGRTFLLDEAVANDRDALMKAIDKIAHVGGCAPCTSGHDLFFDTGKRFIVNERLEINAFA